MQIGGIDHVNILTNDLDATADFYARVLGLTRGESPGTAMGFKGAWMYDARGHPLVHIGLKSPDRDYGADHQPGAVTGAFHHVAFACRDYEAAVERLESAGVTFRGDGTVRNGVRQLFLTDPNNVNIELNFSGE